MNKEKPFRCRLREGETLYGTLLTLPCLEIAEILGGMSELDWIFLDLEHSALSSGEAQHLLQVLQPRKPVLLRVESSDERGIRKALDLGPDGIIVPRVGSKQEAERVMQLAKYPPLGSRSVGFGRASKYGTGFRDYVNSANTNGLVILQAEDRDAVANIEEILSVPGIDGIFVGPFDLSGSYGKLGEVDCAEVTEAVDLILAVCRKNEIAAGIFAASGKVASEQVKRGFSFVAAGTDAMFILRGATAELACLERSGRNS